ncbi:MAG UNVERIFIED_CONTAM: hypothetical protein LVT10_15895 [Anaerolineae bacterium]|jgi:hypothetical protein
MWTPIHKNREVSIKLMSNLRIDIGATSKGEAQGKAPLGTPIMFETVFAPLGNLWSGKALDDRAGCSALVEVLNDAPYDADVLMAFTVQEEVGLRGAKVAAKILKPDVALILETTTAQDLPNPHASEGEDQPNPTCRLGAGVALTVMDAGSITPPQLLRFVEQTAQRHQHPLPIQNQLGRAHRWRNHPKPIRRDSNHHLLHSSSLHPYPHRADRAVGLCQHGGVGQGGVAHPHARGNPTLVAHEQRIFAPDTLLHLALENGYNVRMRAVV